MVFGQRELPAGTAGAGQRVGHCARRRRRYGAAVDFRSRSTQITSMKYRVVIEPDEDGVFVAECPALPGCISQGKTRAEALANIKDAMTGYLASLKKHGEPVPPPISEEIVEIPA
jgi:predicted RNase H-like HicB family nuclease